MINNFDPCEICGAQDWSSIYFGDVRDGIHGCRQSDAEVGRCGECGAERLDESICPDRAFYETDDYRKRLQEELTAEGHNAMADELQIFTQQVMWPASLRGKVIVDVGCAGGSFLDHATGLAAQAVAIEPCSIYHESLKRRGYEVFPYVTNAYEGYTGRIDLAVSSQVIEHVQNPLKFLAEIRPLMAPGGQLIVSTPNRDDILMELLPDDFRAFFYRVTHRWYFDAISLAECARRAGYDVVKTQFVHRYGMSNALAWLRDRCPTGRRRIEVIKPLADDFWLSYLVQTGRTDCLYMVLTPTIEKDD